MKICFVTPYFSTYIKSNEYYLAEGFSRLGYSVDVVTTSAVAARESPYLGGVLVTKVRDEGGLAGGKFCIKYLRALAEIKGNVIPALAPRAFGGDYELFWLQEDYPLICQMAFFEARCRRVPVIISSERYLYPSDPWKKYPLRLLDKTVHRWMWRGSVCLTTHTSAAKLFLMSLGAEPQKISVIPIGVDCSVFRPEESNLLRKKVADPTALIVLTVSRLIYEKGLDLLLMAWKLVLQSYPRAHLVIWGSGPREGELRRLIAGLGIGHAVCLCTDTLPNDEMRAVYSSADAYVQPSRVESFGVSVVEAMACGKPVVATAVGGMKDTVLDGETGYLVPAGNVDALARALCRLLGDENLRREMGIRGRCRVVENFDWEVILVRYDRLFRSVLNR